ncbi:MAG: alpha/beta hydrolase [Hyphomicrobium sp.]|nr:alpha/beta hydrolase [Hyphomicrobium sp.]
MASRKKNRKWAMELPDDLDAWTHRTMTSAADNRHILTLPGDRRVSYAIFGDPSGRPVLCLHGAPSSRLMFSIADSEAKAAGLRLLAPDRPGCGETPPMEPVTLAARVAWLEEVVDALDLERFAILAISGGGPYAVALAAKLGHRINGLALVSPMGPVADYLATPESRNHPISWSQHRFFLDVPRQRWLTRPIAETIGFVYRTVPWGLGGLVPRLISPADRNILSRPAVKTAMHRMTAESFRVSGRGGTDDLEIYSAPWGIRWSDVTAPSVLWQGTSDPIVPVAAALYLAAKLPNCRLVRLDGKGHFWIFDDVPRVIAELADMAGTKPYSNDHDVMPHPP